MDKNEVTGVILAGGRGSRMGGADKGLQTFRGMPMAMYTLMRRELMESLVRFTHEGGRKIDAWTAQHRTVLVPFDRPGDDASAFFNANTLAELHKLEQSS